MAVLACPSCRGSLTAEPAPAAYVVGCPHCRQPLTVPAAEDEPDEPPAEEPVFQTTPAARRRGKYRGAKPSSSGRWVVLGIVFAMLAAAGAGAFVFFGKDKERHQMDSLYSEYSDDIKDGLSGLSEANQNPPPNRGTVEFNRLEEGARSKEVNVRADIVSRTNAARRKLWDDYQAKYGADPKYLPPKDRAAPNPMRARYPTDK